MVPCRGLVTAHVLFYRPRGSPEHWEQTDLWRHAAAIPGVRVLPDEDAAEAQQFGAATSGEALLYDCGGRLMFHGGITNARGHAGASTGAAAIWSLLTRGTAEVTETPVFGCPLFDPGTGETVGETSCK
jgi:hypothetical protein